MPEKICVICGEDCSRRPRTKDPKGRYYCNACYEAARAGASGAAAKSGPVDSPDDVFALGKDDNMALDMLEEIAPAQPAAAADGPAVLPCPGCGVATPAGTVLCTSCGYNLQTGRSAKVKTRHVGAAVSEMAIGLSGRIDAMTFALGAVAIYVALMLLCFVADGGATIVMYFAWHSIFGLTAAVILFVAAFRMHFIHAILLFVPCYVLYFVLITESQWARWVFVAMVLGNIMSFVVGATYAVPEPYTDLVPQPRGEGL